MTKTIIGLLTAATLTIPLAISPASAQYPQGYNGDRGGRGNYGWQGEQHGWNPQQSYHDDRHYKSRRMGRDDQVYRGGDGRYYCKRNDGTTGLVIGAVGGGLLGNAIGGNTLGTLLGAGGGALLGRSIDRGNVKCR